MAESRGLPNSPPLAGRTADPHQPEGCAGGVEVVLVWIKRDIAVGPVFLMQKTGEVAVAKRIKAQATI